MTDLYLIAHKVRGEPAFDIATKIECAECISMGCPECDDCGYWWIIPTSGHRAYPWWHCELFDNGVDIGLGYTDKPDSPPQMPEGLPDHYPLRAQPTISLTEALGIGKPKPKPPLVRRF